MQTPPPAPRKIRPKMVFKFRGGTYNQREFVQWTIVSHVNLQTVVCQWTADQFEVILSNNDGITCDAMQNIINRSPYFVYDKKKVDNDFIFLCSLR